MPAIGNQKTNWTLKQKSFHNESQKKIVTLLGKSAPSQTYPRITFFLYLSNWAITETSVPDIVQLFNQREEKTSRECSIMWRVAGGEGEQGFIIKYYVGAHYAGVQ